jgi:prepilin-type N-terminal cleavage/methylation domain-containing protein
MRNGFTLIELLLVVVIIGIVAALVLPKFGDVKQKAYVAAMKSDLRNLATAQEIYADNNSGSYASVTTDIAGYSLSDGVSVLITPNTGDQGYKADASHTKLPSTKTCSLSIGLSASNKVTCT